MVSQQEDYQQNYGAEPSNGQSVPYRTNNGPFASGAIGPHEASRMRSSTFRRSNDNSSPLSQQSQGLFAQHSGFVGPQQSTTAGPSNSRTISYSRQQQQSPPPPTPPPNPPLSPTPQEITSLSSPATTRPTTSTTARSPFSTPITSPPRTRPNQLLLINPTSTPALTALLLTTLRPILPQSLELTGYNAPYPSPTAIDSTVDSLLSSETTLRDLAKHSTNNGETIQNFDALLVASFSSHPLIPALRESYDVPVLGTLEASLYMARTLGNRFGIITASFRSKIQLEDTVGALGLAHFFVGVESLHVHPLELLALSGSSPGSDDSARARSITPSMGSSRSRDELARRVATQAKVLVAKGADTVILGCEYLCSQEGSRVVKDAVRDEDGRRTVNVIDCVEAGVMMANALVGMGVPTSKQGVYRAERDGRRARGQNWL